MARRKSRWVYIRRGGRVRKVRRLKRR